MDYTQNRIVRPPGMTNDCLLVEGTIKLAGYDADLNIEFPGGQKAVLQWRVDGPTLDLCFEQPVDVFNDGPDMKPAWAVIGRPEQHYGVVQLVIPLPREYSERPAKRPCACCCADHEEDGLYCPKCQRDECSGECSCRAKEPDDVSKKEAKS